MRVTNTRAFTSALLGLAIFGMTTSPSQAVLFLSELFPYSNGNLVTVCPVGTNCVAAGSCWGGHSGCGSAPVQVVSNQIQVKTPAGTEDVNLPLGFTAAGTKVYVAFDLNVAFTVIATGLPVGQNIADTTSGSTENNRYFAHFKNSGTSQFRCRLYVTGFPGATPTTGPNYTLGISPGSATIAPAGTALDPAHPVVKWGAGLDFGTTYRVVSSWDYDTGNCEMWVAPVDVNSTKVSAVGDNLTHRGFNDTCAIPNPCGDAAVNMADCCTPDGLTAVNAYCFREASTTPYGTGNTVTETVDNLCIASSFGEAFTCTPAGALGAFANVNPNPASRGDTVLFTVPVSGGTPFATPNQHYNVTGNLSSLATSGGINNQTFYDDGTHGDLTANDNTYSFGLPISCTQNLQTYTPITMTVSDSVPNTVSPSTSLTVVNGGALTITPGLPSDRVVCLHGSTFFSVTATGGGLTYQWFNGSNVALTNNAHYSGVTTRSLTITDATATEAAAGPYYVKVSALCPTANQNSASANLIIDSATATDKQIVINQVYSGGGCLNGTQCVTGFCNNNACSGGTCNSSSSNPGAICTVVGDCPPKACPNGPQDCGGNPIPCATYDADYVELYNKGTTPVNLRGWSVQFAAATAGSVGQWSATQLSPNADFFLKPGQYFLVKGIVGSPGTFQFALPTPNVTDTGIAMNAAVGEVALYKSTATLAQGGCPFSGDCLLVDLVGYGPGAGALGACFEGSGRTATADAPVGQQQSNAVVRLLCQDTNDNAADFAVSAAMPHNSSFTGSTGIGGTGAGGLSDMNLDGVTNTTDLTLFTTCFDGDPKHRYSYDPNNLPAGCNVFKGCDGKIQADLDRNGVLEFHDFALFQRCYQATIAAEPDCFK